MLKNDLKVALRNLLKHKGHSLINISGLAIGITACLLLFLWVQDELSYDRYHENAERIYRVASQYEVDGHVVRSAKTPAPLGPTLVRDFPGIKKEVRFGFNKFRVSIESRFFHEDVFFADPDVFDIFTFPLVQGNPKTALNDPYSIVISEKTVDKYFGKENPVGKTINLGGLGDFKITGVFKNIPQNSHFRFDLLGSFLLYHKAHSTQWGISHYYTYLLISKEFSLDKYMKNQSQFVEKYKGKESVTLYRQNFPLQPLTGIHLHSNLKGEIEPNSSIDNIYIFSAIALFILIIACLNYINLAAARYVNRAREVGLRKVVGATRPQLIKQFLCESFLLTFFTLPLTMVLSRLFLPLFNSLCGKKLAINYLDNFILLLILIIVFLFVGLVSGIFPALFISGLKPLKALRGIFNPISIFCLIRRSMVVFQFALSIAFIICAIIISNQLDFLRNKNLGFDKEHIINIPIYNKDALEKYETVKREFLNNAHVLAVCASNFFPGKNNFSINYRCGCVGSKKNPMISYICVNHDFIDAYRINIVEGRNFSRKYPGDVESAYILNESAVKTIGWESAIGKEFNIGSRKNGRIIGVVEDFNFQSLHKKIKPAVLFILPQIFSHFSIRVHQKNIPNTIAFLKDKWQELFPGESFRYSFLDDDSDNLYKTEMKLGKTITVVSAFAVFIACLGLLGLASFAAEQRIKEIGIRKVLGASVHGLILLLSKQFTSWVLISNIIAWPIAWYAMNKWLQNFAFRTKIEIWTFLAAGLFAFGIALLTVSYKSVRAASANPVDSLRYE